MKEKPVGKSKKKHTPKRTFNKIRRALLTGLSGGYKSINELSSIAKVNWRTTSKHLVFLVGMKYVKEIFTSPKVRIFEITERGMEVLAKNEI